MAIPGYLQVVKDKDYKLGDQIGGGGMSSVRLAKVISQALLEQSHSRVAAAKIFHRMSLKFSCIVLITTF